MIHFIIEISSAIGKNGKSPMPIRERKKYTREIDASDYQTALIKYRKDLQNKIPAQYDYKFKITDSAGNQYGDNVSW